MKNHIIIKDLDELLQQAFRRKITVEKFTTKRLTAAGENYGSLMLALEIKLHKNGESAQENVLKLVAKLCPPNEWLKKMFNIQVTFRREIEMYKEIIPSLQAFQSEQGVSEVMTCFPECYGARINLDPHSDIVNDDAVLMLENLNFSEFQVMDRMKGFTLEAAELILKDLAVFHAVPVAMKLLKPDEFRKKILSHLKEMQLFNHLSENSEKAMFDIIIETAKLNEKCAPLTPIIEKALKQGLNKMRNQAPPREPFATINHNDYWVNNTMIKFKDGKPIKNKMVDFQLITYGSPGNDIVFFLFSSVQKKVLDLHYNSLINLYYNTFISTLNNLKCNITPFTFDLLQEEISACAKATQFFHVMSMLRPIFATKGKMKDLNEMKEDDFNRPDMTSEEYKQKVPEIILSFFDRNWITTES